MNALQAEPAEIVAELPLRKGPGERLRSARKAKGIDLGLAARELHLPEDRLAALERDEYSVIPGRVFVRGYLRNYARLVGLPPEAAARGKGGGKSAAGSLSLTRLVHRPDKLDGVCVVTCASRTTHGGGLRSVASNGMNSRG